MKRKLYANMKRLTTIFCISIACVTVVVLLARLFFFKDMVTASKEPTKNSIVHGDDLFSYSYNSKVYFSSPTDEGDVLIENPRDNQCLLSATILDPDTQDSYLYTGFIEPGGVVDTSKLDLALDQGIHKFTIKITAYTLKAPHEPLGNIEESIELYVGEKPE